MNTKNRIVLLIAAIGIILFSCDKPLNVLADCKAGITGDTVLFSVNKPQPIFENCLQNIQASVISINDSRCPKGATCIWQGNLTAVIQLGSQFMVSLEQGKTKDTTYLNNSYSITLVDASPYPSISPPTTPGQFAQIRILKK